MLTGYELLRKYTSVEEQVKYGLDTMGAERKIEVPLRDLLRVYQTIGLLINFFHQPLHYPTLESVKEFPGDEGKGAYHLLPEIYYKRLYDIWPEDIRQGFDESRFDNPDPPCYYKPAS